MNIEPRGLVSYRKVFVFGMSSCKTNGKKKTERERGKRMKMCKLTVKAGIASGVLLLAGMAVAAANRPNIIWLMAEDMGQDLACYGMKGVKTPTLDRMAANGRKYNNAFCTNPICSPSRSAMMVGVHQNIINAYMHRSNRGRPLAEPYKPITFYLRRAGYTCLLGHDLVFNKGRKIDCNFKTRQTGPYDGKKKFGLFDAARPFRAADQPFFSQIQLKITHRGDWWNDVRQISKHPVNLDEIELPPYIPDTPQTRLDWAAYLDTVEYMDHEVDMLIDDLKKKGILENTVIIFIADNGRCNVRGKGYLHEPGLRIPLIVWGPRKWIRRAEVDDVVSTLDISATLLHLAGVALPDYMEARPLIGTDKPQSRNFVYSARDGWDEVNECMRSVYTKKFAYIRNYLPELPYDQHQAYLDFYRPALHVMRSLKEQGKLDGDAALFMADQKPPEELYDSDKDPFQVHNLAGNPEYAEVLRDMRTKMDSWQSMHKDLGLVGYKDRKCRPPRSVKKRRNLMENHPEIWRRYLNGEIVGDQKLK